VRPCQSAALPVRRHGRGRSSTCGTPRLPSRSAARTCRRPLPATVSPAAAGSWDLGEIEFRNGALRGRADAGEEMSRMGDTYKAGRLEIYRVEAAARPWTRIIRRAPAARPCLRRRSLPVQVWRPIESDSRVGFIPPAVE
jgi:hypothetical protein